MSVIQITNPRIDITNSGCRYTATVLGIEDLDEIWYELDSTDFSSTLIHFQNALAVAFIFIAYERERDLNLEFSIDEKLFSGIHSHIIPALNRVFNQSIKIKCESILLTQKEANGGATGMSGGVDSFATYYTFKHKLKYFTFFNAGSHGEHGKTFAERLNQKAYDRALQIAESLNVKLIKVVSNISNFTTRRFQDNHSFFQLSCAHLLTQKIDKYFYSTGQHESYLDNNSFDLIYINNFLTTYLSSNSLTIEPSLSQFTRMERVELIASEDTPKQYLDVCTTPLQSERSDILNCGTCEKCMRTQWQLDLLGQLPKYSAVFPLELFKANKWQFIHSILWFPKSDDHREIIKNLKRKKKLPIFRYIKAIPFILKPVRSRIRSFLKALFLQ